MEEIIAERCATIKALCEDDSRDFSKIAFDIKAEADAILQQLSDGDPT